MDLLKERGLILEIDPPVDDISIRRKGFMKDAVLLKISILIFILRIISEIPDMS